jgi:hypothetical protein
MTDTALVESKVNRELADTIAIGKGGINFQNAGEVMEYAKMMAASGTAVPKHLRGQPGACLGIIDDAIRLGVNPYALARKSYFVNDLLAYESAVFMALVNTKAPLKTRPDIRFEGDGQEMRAIVTGKFLDGASREYRSPRIADISPKNSPLWKTDPAQQLSYYSLRAFARRWVPEVILGIHDVDEIREAAMQDITPEAGAASRPMPKSLDDFAASRAAVLDSDLGVSSRPPNNDATGSSELPPPSAHDLAAAQLRRSNALELLLEIATDEELDIEDRVAKIDGFGPRMAAEQLKGDMDFHKALFETAVKVARGQLKPDGARKFLEGMA